MSRRDYFKSDDNDEPTALKEHEPLWVQVDDDGTIVEVIGDNADRAKWDADGNPVYGIFTEADLRAAYGDDYQEKFRQYFLGHNENTVEVWFGAASPPREYDPWGDMFQSALCRRFLGDRKPTLDEGLQLILAEHKARRCSKCRHRIGWGDIAWNNGSTESGTEYCTVEIQCVACDHEITHIDSWYPGIEGRDEVIKVLYQDWDEYI